MTDIEYHCSCKHRRCLSRAEHIGTGPHISGASMPTRSLYSHDLATEKQWEKDAAAFRRLDANGTPPSKMAGAAELEARHTKPIELEHGKLYGKSAGTMQKLVAGDFS